MLYDKKNKNKKLFFKQYTVKTYEPTKKKKKKFGNKYFVIWQDVLCNT